MLAALDPTAVLRRKELRPTMLVGFKVNSKISEVATKDIGTELGESYRMKFFRHLNANRLCFLSIGVSTRSG